MTPHLSNICRYLVISGLIGISLGSLAKVSQVNATAVSSYDIDVTWSSVAGGTSYEILYKRNDGIAVDTGIESSAGTSKQISGRMKYARYIINVRATSTSGVGLWSDNPVIVTTLENVPTKSPSSLILVKEGSSLNITWTEIPEIGRGGVIKGYVVTYFKASGGTVKNFSTQGRTHTLSGLDPQSEYAVYVNGYTRIGNSTYSTSAVSNTKPYFDYTLLKPIYCYQVIPGSPLLDKAIGCWVFPVAAFVLIIFIVLTALLLCNVAYRSGNKSYQRYERFMEEYNRHFVRKEKKLDTAGGLLFGKKRLPLPIIVEPRTGTALSQSNVLLIEEAEW